MRTYVVAAGSALVMSLAACGSERADTGFGPAPSRADCQSPAPLLGTPDPRAPGYIVVYRDGVDAAAETQRLAASLGFTPSAVWPSRPGAAGFSGFAAPLTDTALGAVRCTASVKYVEHDGIMSLGG